MSDLIKNEEIFSQLEQTKDFRFVSEFSQWLRKTRLKHNVMLLDFADALGVNAPKVSAWENDKELLTNIQAIKIAKFFKEKGEITNYVELMKMQRKAIFTPLSTLYNSLILKGLKFNNFLAKNCKPSIYRALEKRVESQVIFINLIEARKNFNEIIDSIKGK